MIPPLIGQYPGFFETIQFLASQELIPELAVKALILAVLPRATRCDKRRLDVEHCQPVLKDFGRKFTAIITADIIRKTSGLKHFGQRISAFK